MNKYFDIKDKVFDITEKYPETIDVFVANGFKPLANEAMRRTMGKTISLEMALKSKNINIEQFVERLVEVIEQNRVSEDEALVQKEQVEEADIRISGVLPCPVKVPLMDAFNSWMEEEGNKLNVTVSHDLKAAFQGIDWLREEIEKAEDEEDLPDLMISAGFELFFDRKLMGRFKEKGTFEDMLSFEKLNEDFENEYISLREPDGHYSIIAVVPAVFLVNTEELEGMEMPKTWEDILKPEFENRVSLPTGDLDMFNAILVNIYKQYGKEGISRLKKALSISLHPSEMVKAHRKKQKPIVTVIPYFFTKMARADGPMKAVWPEDGAIISPILLLAKKSKKNILKPFVDFFTSKEVGEILAQKGSLPSTNPEVDNQIPKENKYMWLGWDYIKEVDIEQLINKCQKIFDETD